VRDEKDDDDAWAKKERDYAPLELSWSISNKKWTTTNKKCMAFIENTIEPSLLSLIEGCTSATELLDKIKSQFTGSSKTYATMMLRQLVNEKYTGNGKGVREHILKMSIQESKLKPLDEELLRSLFTWLWLPCQRSLTLLLPSTTYIQSSGIWKRL
jgi:hypothetical protein